MQAVGIIFCAAGIILRHMVGTHIDFFVGNTLVCGTGETARAAIEMNIAQAKSIWNGSCN